MSLALNPPLCTLTCTPRIALPLPDGNTPTHTLAIPAEIHTTHADLVAAIITKSDLILSFLTATLHWRAHALLARAIAFHAPTLRTCGPQALGAAARFLEGGEDDGAAAVVVEVPPPGLIALKTAVRALGAARVVGTMAWIEDQEIAGRALKLAVGVLGARQRWCAGCVRVFYVVSGVESTMLAAMTSGPMGVTDCGHVLCRECVVAWLNDAQARGRKGMQPCCRAQVQRNRPNTTQQALERLLEEIPE